MATVTAQQPVPAHQLSLDNPQELPKLRSNHGKYLDPASIGAMRATPADTSIEEIRRRFNEDGYVWMKGVMPREDVLDMREHYFTHISATGILDPTTDPRAGIFNPSEDPTHHNGVGGANLPDSQQKQEALTTVHASPIYRTFLAHPSLRHFIRTLMGWPREQMVIRNLLRHNVPGGVSTGIHYDRLFLRAGESEFLTAWIPIGDIVKNGGGLTYLEHSDSLGRDMERDFLAGSVDLPPEERVRAFNVRMNNDGFLAHDVESWGKEVEAKFDTACKEHAGEVVEGGGSGGKGWAASGGKVSGSGGAQGEKNKFRWLVADYEAGDVVFHNPYMIHTACKNEDPLGRIRLGSDVRFYEHGANYDERWCQQLWHPDDGL